MGPRLFGFNVNELAACRRSPWRTAREPQQAPFPIAIAIGLDPAMTIAAGVKTDADELEIAGAIRGLRCGSYPWCHG